MYYCAFENCKNCVISLDLGIVVIAEVFGSLDGLWKVKLQGKLAENFMEFSFCILLFNILPLYLVALFCFEHCFSKCFTSEYRGIHAWALCIAMFSNGFPQVCIAKYH